MSILLRLCDALFVHCAEAILSYRTTGNRLHLLDALLVLVVGLPEWHSNLPQKNALQTTPSSNTRKSIRILTPLVASVRCTLGSLCHRRRREFATNGSCICAMHFMFIVPAASRLATLNPSALHLCDALYVHCAWAPGRDRCAVRSCSCAMHFMYIVPCHI